MPTFSNSHIPPTASPEKDSSEVFPEVPAGTTSSPVAEDPSLPLFPVDGRETSPPHASSPSIAFVSPPHDSLLIHQFRSAPLEVIHKLKADLDLDLTPSDLLRLQGLYRSTLKRDPSVGELRLLVASDRSGRTLPSRVAVGELYTNSSDLAKTWADMIDTHACLCSSEGRGAGIEDPLPPCSFEEVATLWERYLYRTGQVLPATYGASSKKHGAERTVSVLSPSHEAHALAEGYTPVACVGMGESRRIICLRDRKRPRGLLQRDVHPLFHLKNVPHSLAAALATMLRDKDYPFKGELRAILGRSVLETILDICEGAILLWDALCPSPQDPTLPLDTAPLCEPILPSERDTADYILRASPLFESELRKELQGLGLSFTSIGMTQTQPRISLRIRTENNSLPVIAELPSAVLRAYPMPALIRCHAEAHPSRELTLPPVVLGRVPQAGLLMTSMTITVTQQGQGFPLALQALRDLSAPLQAQGIPPREQRLSMALTAAEGKEGFGGLTLEVLCGLYHIASELGLSMEDPMLSSPPPSEGSAPSPTLSLSLVLWAGHPSASSEETIPTVSVPYHLPTSPLSAIGDEMTSSTTEAKGSNTMRSIFEPLSQKPRSVILDTDIGPDCDDVGALVCLLHYAKQYHFPILGICNCTSNKAGTGTIDAVCRHCGIETPYLGQWSHEGFMDDAACHKYNDAVAEGFSEAYRQGELNPVDEVTFYRTLLSKAKDDEVMLITIGMFNDLAALLASPPDELSPLNGLELVKAKVHCLVSMAAILPEGRECNVISDSESAKAVFSLWPTPIFLSDFHIGWKIMTGYEHIQEPAAIQSSPLTLAYHLYTKDWTHLPMKGMNSSYDLTAIQFAVEGEGTYYSLLEPVELEFYAAIPEQPEVVDATRILPSPEGRFHFMKKEASDEAIRDSLNHILRSY